MHTALIFLPLAAMVVVVRAVKKMAVLLQRLLEQQTQAAVEAVVELRLLRTQWLALLGVQASSLFLTPALPSKWLVAR